ncbi:hypothetical protein TBLA_0G03050 [Henningerozyma blattae CBS 6284]|uniref:DNA-binding protein REB1 n=1 Tax=Henningerozyma blattae (strain ATCC 34711 / CBS 6284 / DSM 70876 / NBRC 10599 / NRRL Y-10934 / UCD 77-7) TaxID=1071380 RepID=I2H790_HENB6|nr:hypothetical protein TBLA_0G03050 [Tetrapisispora blattae CBS 6284]CCH62242.1 hypothetical protein TBLA_0G03050 [Tetrapisispora blattae CBS 6284]
MSLSNNNRTNKHIIGAELDNNDQESRHESVEEAVFKYVGVGLNNDDEPENDSGSDLDSSKDRKHYGSKSHNSQDQDGEDDDEDIDVDLVGPKVDHLNSNSTTTAEMEWFFRHADTDVNNQSISSHETESDSTNNNRDPHSVAIAAVAAALASENDVGNEADPTKLSNKRSRADMIDEDDEGDENLSTNNSNDTSNDLDNDQDIQRHSHKKAKNNNNKTKLHLAVDPELATLDDNEDNNDEVSEHDQLVRRAIIDTDSIAQHPDFQQYLNTEEEISNNNNKDKESIQSSSNVASHNINDSNSGRRSRNDISMNNMNSKNKNDLSASSNNTHSSRTDMLASVAIETDTRDSSISNNNNKSNLNDLINEHNNEDLRLHDQSLVNGALAISELSGITTDKLQKHHSLDEVLAAHLQQNKKSSSLQSKQDIRNHLDVIPMSRDSQKFPHIKVDQQDHMHDHSLLSHASQSHISRQNGKSLNDQHLSSNNNGIHSQSDESLGSDNHHSEPQHYRDVLPKVNIPLDYTEVPDISKLIQSAAIKASTIFVTTTQSNGKSFDSQEEAALEQFVNDYQTIKGMSRHDVCNRIWCNERKKDDFWVNICKVLPHRTRSSIYKHVRRKYHIFEQRGKWTDEEERQLARLCAQKEGQWSEIGKTLGRMPEDCRDRWRNYLKCGGNRASHKWSEEEEEELKRVVNAMLVDAHKADAQAQAKLEQEAKTEEDLEELRNKRPAIRNFKSIVNWTVVSEMMNGTRSRIQCRYKWNKLLKKETIAKVETITLHDKRWILEKLRDLGFTENSQVDWEELSRLKPGIKLNGNELKMCFEKMRNNIKSFKEKTINDICRDLLLLLDTTGNIDELKSSID